MSCFAFLRVDQASYGFYGLRTMVFCDFIHGVLLSAISCMLFLWDSYDVDLRLRGCIAFSVIPCSSLHRLGLFNRGVVQGKGGL